MRKIVMKLVLTADDDIAAMELDELAAAVENAAEAYPSIQEAGIWKASVAIRVPVEDGT